ncbi:MAG: hypothetical protein M3041_16315 [Acidobacteriota bacterium]|nr:hypothetical protein [Acidobacteriota bacterium]
MSETVPASASNVACTPIGDPIVVEQRKKARRARVPVISQRLSRRQRRSKGA